MGKPKQKETVVWNDDDVWADFDEMAESEPLTPAAGETLTTTGEVTEAQQQAENAPGASVEAPAAMAVEPRAEAALPETVAATSLSDPTAATPAEATPWPVVQIRRKGISLVKRPVETSVQEIAKEPARSAESLPPPLPKTWFSPKLPSTTKSPVSPEPVGPLRNAMPKPPPLPAELPPPVPRMPELPSGAKATKEILLRKPPTGISSIFMRPEATKEELTAREPSATEVAVSPVIGPKKEAHPKLGPAFSRGVEADRKTE